MLRGKTCGELDRQSVVRKFRIVQREDRRVTLSRKTAKDEALPKGWRRVKLGELCSDISYGYTATASSKPIGPKFLRITDIVSDRISWEDVPYCKIEDSKIDKYTLGIGDIVIARTGATTGYNQIIRSDVHSVFASYLIRCKLKQSIAYPFFISCVLQSAYWRNFIEGIKVVLHSQEQTQKTFPVSDSLYLPYPSKKPSPPYWKRGTRRLRKPKH